MSVFVFCFQSASKRKAVLSLCLYANPSVIGQIEGKRGGLDSLLQTHIFTIFKTANLASPITLTHSIWLWIVGEN